MRAFVLAVVAALVLCACERPNTSDATLRAEAYPVPTSQIEGDWRLHSVGGARAKSLLMLSIERTNFRLDGCGTIRGRAPPSSGERFLRPDIGSPGCAEAAWKEHRTVERLLRSEPTATLARQPVEGCPGPALELRDGQDVAVFCPPMPSEG